MRVVSAKKIKYGVKSRDSPQINQEIIGYQYILEKSKFRMTNYPEFLKMKLSSKRYYALPFGGKKRKGEN